MRRTVGYVLFGLAGFLVTAAVLVLVWVPGQVKKTPLDVDTVTRLTGNAAVLPTGPGSAVKAISHSVADGGASDGSTSSSSTPSPASSRTPTVTRPTASTTRTPTSAS